MNLYEQIIQQGAGTAMTLEEFLEKEIEVWETSATRRMQIIADNYYRGKHDILQAKRTAIGPDGELTEINSLPNNKIIDNQYGKAVDQKTNYSFAKPFTVETKNETYADLLNGFFNHRFRLMFKNMAKDAINCGIDWLHPYYDELGQFKVKRFRPWEILPFWRDADHTEIDSFLRLYIVEGYEGNKPVKIKKVEYYDDNGVRRYELISGKLVPDVTNALGDESTHYAAILENGTEQPLNWRRVPLIGFKFDAEETPLISRVKSLQDAINTIVSNFMNNMQEDVRNTILVLENYDGTDLGQFRNNLALYGAVKVKSIDGMRGGVSTLHIEVSKDNYESILKILKAALIENARALDAKDDRMGNSPNQMNIKSMYSDLDLDANGIEAEFRAGFEDLLWFINMYFADNGLGDFTAETVDITFNRDILMNESETITNCKSSVGVVSDRTILENHPWVTDIEKELGELEAQRKKAMETYSTPNPGDPNPDGGGVDG